MKEPGQMFAELWFSANCWSSLDHEEREQCAKLEATIRADERAKTVEECARVAEREKRLREALEKIAFGPPHEGEVKHVLNTLVEIAQLALKEA